MFSNESSFMFNVGSVALNKGILPGTTDEFLLALKAYGATLPGLYKEQSQGVVDKRLAALKTRFGDFYGLLDVTQISAMVWDDTLFQKVMTNNQAAYDYVYTGVASQSQMHDYWNDEKLQPLQDFFLPTTTTAVTQPPS